MQEFSKSMGKLESYGQFNEKIIDEMDGGHFVYLLWLQLSQPSDVTSVSVRVTSQRHVCIELAINLIESAPIYSAEPPRYQ